MEAISKNNVYTEKENNMEKLNRAIIKEEYVAITGDFIKAIILNQFIYWSERINDVDKYIIEENKRLCQKGDNPIELTDGWIYKTCEELSKETMLNLTNATIRNHISKLVELGFLDERQNPKYKWDRTKQYRVNLINIIKALSDKGYHLQDYKYDVSLIKNAILKNKNGSLKNENGSYENQNAIPKTTTETTTKTTTDIKEINIKENQSRSTSGVKFDTTRDSNFDTTRDINFDTTLNKKEINKKEEVKTNINNVKESVLKEKSKHKYGEYQRILLTDDEYNKLCNEYGKDYINDVIERIDEYVEQNNNKNKYKNFYLVIKKAIRDKWSILNGIEKDYYDDENFF